MVRELSRVGGTMNAKKDDELIITFESQGWSSTAITN